jgi:hypothetical protein
MSELVVTAAAPVSFDFHRYMRKTRGGKIKPAAKCKGNMAIRITVIVLLGLTIYGFLTFNYKNVNLAQAIVGTALTKATILLTTFPTMGFAMFLAHNKAPKKAMIAPLIVESTPNENATSNPHIAPANVICVNCGEPNMVTALRKVPTIACAK